MWTASGVSVCHWTGGERPATKPSSSVSSYVEANLSVRARARSMARSRTLVDGDSRMHTAASTSSSADLGGTPLEGVQHVGAWTGFSPHLLLRLLCTCSPHSAGPDDKHAGAQSDHVGALRWAARWASDMAAHTSSLLFARRSLTTRAPLWQNASMCYEHPPRKGWLGSVSRRRWATVRGNSVN